MNPSQARVDAMRAIARGDAAFRTTLEMLSRPEVINNPTAITDAATTVRTVIDAAGEAAELLEGIPQAVKDSKDADRKANTPAPTRKAKPQHAPSRKHETHEHAVEARAEG